LVALLRPSRARFWLVLVALAAILAGVSCSVFVPPVRTAERTATLLPSFFVQLPVDPSGWISPPLEQSEISLGDGYPGATLYVYRLREGRHPALIVSLGVEAAPPDNPAVVRFLRGLARAGIVAVLVQSPALDAGSLPSDAPDVLVAAFRAIAAQPFTDSSRIGLLGLSVGGSLALIAAADPRIRDQARLVEAFGAYDRLASLMRAAITRSIKIDGRTQPWQPDAITTNVVRMNLIDLLAEPSDRALLDPAFASATTTPTQAPAGLSPEGLQVFRLLTATNPAQFDALYASIPAPVQAELDALSPENYLGQVRAPVYLMVDDGDPIIPYVESRQIQATLRRDGHPAYFSQFSIFRHVEPTRGGSLLGLVRDLVRLYAHVDAVLTRL
jgi:dienelactone hydrolase